MWMTLAQVASKNGRELSRQQRIFTTRLCFDLSTLMFDVRVGGCGEASLRVMIHV
jgi:hypothetical protein